MAKHQKTLYTLAGVAAAMVAVLFLIALPDMLSTGSQGYLLPNNFIVLIIKLHAGIGGVALTTLDGINLLDGTLVVLVGLIAVGLYPVLKRVNTVWAVIAAALPFVGLIMFFITQGTGRSGMLAAGLILSLLMLWSDAIGKATAIIGIVASGLLLIGDISTAFTFSPILAIVMGTGYVLTIVWCTLIAIALLRKH
ncbi:MAG: hypothetical protein JXJ17_19675 [Anaerolineae bacterium]|nr:hypothetical protein [Anaerolineae bacterium]